MELWLTGKFDLLTIIILRGNTMTIRLLAAVAALAATAAATAAAAESFTFTYTNEAPSMVSAATSAGPMYAGSWKGTTVAVSKSGASVKSTYQCTGWPTPGQATNQASICNFIDATGDKYTVTYNCLETTKGPGMCWGYLQGVSGKYAAKVGAVSQMGNGVTGAGQGAWAD